MPRLPRYDQRTAVIGRTGDGKTQFACWLLSTADFDARPWFIFDFKGDDLIRAIAPKEISLTSPPPVKPGLYVVRPIPELHDELVTQFLWKLWAMGNCGIYIDEGYMLGNRNPALNACLTQGRSKHIQMIVLSQRPVWMSKFVFSEADFFAIFSLSMNDDKKVVSGYINNTEIGVLPKYHCLWYDVAKQEPTIFSPVPDRAEIVEVFKNRLQKRARTI